MPEKLDVKDTVSSRPSIIRPHSPYCEAKGPIVEEGYVARRIRALQEARDQAQTPNKSHSPQIVCPARHYQVVPTPIPTPERRNAPKIKLRFDGFEESQSPDNVDHSYEPRTPLRTRFRPQLEPGANTKSEGEATHQATTPEQCLPPSMRLQPVSTIVDRPRREDPPKTIPRRTVSEYARCLNTNQRSPTPVHPYSRQAAREKVPVGFSAAIEKETQRRLESRQTSKSITNELGEMLDEALSVTGRKLGSPPESIFTAPSSMSGRSYISDVPGDEMSTRRPALPRNIDLNLGEAAKALSHHQPRHNTLWPDIASHESDDENDYVPPQLTALPGRKYISQNRSTSADTLFPPTSTDAGLYLDYRPSPSLGYRPAPSPTRGRPRTRILHSGATPRRRSNDGLPVTKRTISASRTARPKLAAETIHRHSEIHSPQCPQEDDWLVASPTQRSPACPSRVPWPFVSSTRPPAVQPVRHVSAPTPTELPKKAWRWWKFVLADKTPPSESRRTSAVSQATSVIEIPQRLSQQDVTKHSDDESRIKDVRVIPMAGDGSASTESDQVGKGANAERVAVRLDHMEGQEMKVKGKRILGIRIVVRLDGGEDLVVETRSEGGFVRMG